ncbi:MAG: hypothetical protein HYT31_03130 [Parcubacteria group bacterium]|nr:hypothetical protein [Parcubacteria group bacterium]
MPSITQPIQALVQAALASKREQDIDPQEPKIAIPTRAAAASFVYERMRNAVDYKEEHLIRRNAIERILRRMLSQGERENIAENLVYELIHARYLPNNAIPQRKLGDLKKIFDKYVAILGFAHLKDAADRASLPGFMLGIFATEVDEFLVPPHVMHASINAMYESMDRHMHIERAGIPPEDRAKQIYLAASRALYKNDNDTLAYHLMLVYCPRWRNADPSLIRDVGARLEELRQKISADLNHPLKEKLAAALRKRVAYFAIVRDIIVGDPSNAWHDLQTPGLAFEARIRERCGENYKASRTSLHRSITRSIIYLVITKFLLFLVLEIPVDYFIMKHFALAPIAINLLFPPSLLAIIALSTKLPDEKNTDLIVTGIQDIVEGRGDLVQVAKSARRSLVRGAVFIVLYAMLFAVSFGLLIYILQLLEFTAVSILVFLFFLSLVSLFAYRIRLANQELIVTPPKRGMFRALWSFFTLPVLHAGKWMSTRFAHINVFIFVLDFVIEAPFKAFIKVIEEWMNYVYEKKEEI